MRGTVRPVHRGRANQPTSRSPHLVGAKKTARWAGMSMLSALLLIALPSPAFAHLPSAVSFTYTCTGGEGTSSTNGVCWVRHSNANADWFPYGSPPTDVVARWRNGAAAWDQTNGHQFNYVERNDSSSSPAYWFPGDPCGNSNFVACAYITYSNYFIVENSSYTEFESDLYWYTGTGAPFPGQIDLWSLASHEFGHLVGLGHSANSSQTMYGTIATASTHARSLEAGDRLGRCEIYGHSDGYWGGC